MNVLVIPKITPNKVYELIRSNVLNVLTFQRLFVPTFQRSNVLGDSMANITLEKNHALLEKLAAYVMTELPTRKEMDAKLAQKADKQDVLELEKRVHSVEKKMDLMLNGMDAQAKQLDRLSNELSAVSRTLDIHNQRLGNLEEHTLGYRVRNKEE